MSELRGAHGREKENEDAAASVLRVEDERAYSETSVITYRRTRHQTNP
jgi:hypothetical protein